MLLLLLLTYDMTCTLVRAFVVVLVFVENVPNGVFGGVADDRRVCLSVEVRSDCLVHCVVRSARHERLESREQYSDITLNKHAHKHNKRNTHTHTRGLNVTVSIGGRVVFSDDLCRTLRSESPRQGVNDVQYLFVCHLRNVVSVRVLFTL